MTNSFLLRHLGPREADVDSMLEAVGVASMEELIKDTLPEGIRLTDSLRLPGAISEEAYHRSLQHLASQNKVCKSYIGMGYYDCNTPSVIRRTVFENPSWYTPYTPYQAEIAQGRLEALLNYQTMVADLTGLPVANASLLDEATAASEAMTMIHRIQKKKVRAGANKFIVAEETYPHTHDVLRGRAEPLGFELELCPLEKISPPEDVLGIIVQSPDDNGRLHDLTALCEEAHAAGALVAAGTDLLSLLLVKPPGEMGADIVFGNSQRFGVPMGFGGPHAAFFASRDEYKREIPGRIIGVSVDAEGNRAYRMALQTREQHIRREKAKSNICTAQALLATMAGFYAVYHGPEGLRSIAERINTLARILEREFRLLGFEEVNGEYFDTLKFSIPDSSGKLSEKIREATEHTRQNIRYFDQEHVGVAIDEATEPEDLELLIKSFARAVNMKMPVVNFALMRDAYEYDLPESLQRSSAYLNHPVFHSHRSETEMMRYIKLLERKDLGLDTSMIPLGSCTMKLNAASEMIPVSWLSFSKLHPFAPAEQTMGYRRVFKELESALCEVTGFDAVSLQPNSGAQGEYAGLMVIRAYHRDNGNTDRDVVLIPSSAHGTNPATAAMAGMRVVVVKCDENGNVDVVDLGAKAAEHARQLAALMITYPSTHGVFEESIQEICAIIHNYGGQVYMDGANLNAQVGLTNPAIVGADVCHINLHKTFSIPHGGGGPGMGPIAVARHLASYLPGHAVVPRMGGEQGIPAISAAPWGSPSIMLISYGYIAMLGRKGVTEATRYAILNANYIKARLKEHYDVLFTGSRGHVAHEMVFDLRPFKQEAGIDETDVAKRLMDYGFHAPTVSWPVPGTMMIEPTECESKAELDRFCDALISIREEIRAISEGRADREDNVLKHAPHTTGMVAANEWTHPYSREEAAYPLPYLRENKFWPAVARIDNPYGDRNLVCTCPPLEAYEASL